MNTSLRLFTAAALMMMPSLAFAQADPHHPDAGAAADAPAAAAAAPAAPAAGDQPANMMQMMQGMQMMQMMQMMQQMMGMMQGGMMQGGMGPGGMASGAPSGGAQNMPMGAGMSDAGKAYMSAMSMMNAPMMQALQSSDPDAAFVKAMIPHHQGAIAMAKAVLEYGKDDKVKAWAGQIIKAQEAEIAEMQAWLKGRAQ